MGAVGPGVRLLRAFLALQTFHQRGIDAAAGSGDPGGNGPEREVVVGVLRGLGLLVVLAQHAHHGGWRRVLAFLLSDGDDKPTGDVAQAHVLVTEVDGDGEHRVVGDGGAADRLAPGAGGLVAFQGAVADVLALAFGERGQDGEHHAGRVVRPLQLTLEELQPDPVGAELLGERRELDAAAEPLVLWTTIVTAAPDERMSRARATALSSSGRTFTRVEIFSAKTLVMPAPASASVWVLSDWRAVEARAYPILTCPDGAAPAAGGGAARSRPGRPPCSARPGMIP